MKVKAKGPAGKKYVGFYGTKRIRPGDVFTLTDVKHFSKRWMEKVDGRKKASIAAEIDTSAHSVEEKLN